MKTSLRFQHTPQAMQKIKRRRRRKIKTPEQPVVEVVNVQERENSIVPKWVSISIIVSLMFGTFEAWTRFHFSFKALGRT